MAVLVASFQIAPFGPRFTDFLAVALVVLATAGATLFRQRFRVQSIDLIVFATGLVVVISALIPLGVDPTQQGVAALYVVRFLVVYVLMRLTIRTVTDATRLAVFCVTIGALPIIYALAELMLFSFASYTPRSFYLAPDGALRFIGFLENPNYYGHLIVIHLGLGLGLLFSRGAHANGTFRRFGLLSLIVLNFSGILLTQSRGALFAALVVTLVACFTVAVGTLRRGRVRRGEAALILSGVAVCVLSAVLVFTSGSIQARLVDAVEGTGAGRYALWTDSIAFFVGLDATRKLIGIGGNQFTAVTHLSDWPHNNYILILIEHGLLGIAVSALLALWGVRLLWRSCGHRSLAALPMVGAFVFAASNDTFVTVHFAFAVAYALVLTLVSQPSGPLYTRSFIRR